MTRSSISRALASLALIGGLGGCAYLPHVSHWVRIRPVQSTAVARNTREDNYYASAVTAISRRDYGEALDLLQAADARKPDDVRVINAFGVVYDKLGRFDLSDRYYAEARTLDPRSPIVAHNIAYSAMMRSKADASVKDEPIVQLAQATSASPADLEAVAPAATPTVLAEARPAVFRLGFAHQTAAPIQLALVGRAVEIADASGRKNGAAPVRQQLVRLGWTMPTLDERAPRRVARTTVNYSPASANVAHALARTLPVGVELVDCGQTCDGVRLVVGEDALNWSWRGAALQKQRGE